MDEPGGGLAEGTFGSLTAKRGRRRTLKQPSAGRMLRLCCTQQCDKDRSEQPEYPRSIQHARAATSPAQLRHAAESINYLLCQATIGDSQIRLSQAQARRRAWTDTCSAHA